MVHVLPLLAISLAFYPTKYLQQAYLVASLSAHHKTTEARHRLLSATVIFHCVTTSTNIEITAVQAVTQTYHTQTQAVVVTQSQIS